MILSDDEIIGIKDYAELIRKLEILAVDMHWPLMAEAADTIDELRRDAERYRWLRDNPWNGTEVENVINCHLYAVWDRVIDAAIKESK